MRIAVRLPQIAVLLLLAACTQSGEGTSSQDEEVEPRPVSQALPDWLPPYPSISQNYVSETDTSSLNYITADSVSQVLGFYRRELTKAGFTIEDDPAAGAFGTIGGGTVGRLQASRLRDGEAVQFEMIVQDQVTSRQVAASWTTRRL